MVELARSRLWLFSSSALLSICLLRFFTAQQGGFAPLPLSRKYGAEETMAGKGGDRDGRTKAILEERGGGPETDRG